MVRKLAQLVQQVIVCALMVLPFAAIVKRLLLLDAFEHHLGLAESERDENTSQSAQNQRSTDHATRQ